MANTYTNRSTHSSPRNLLVTFFILCHVFSPICAQSAQTWTRDASESRLGAPGDLLSPPLTIDRPATVTETYGATLTFSSGSQVLTTQPLVGLKPPGTSRQTEQILIIFVTFTFVMLISLFLYTFMYKRRRKSGDNGNVIAQQPSPYDLQEVTSSRSSKSSIQPAHASPSADRPSTRRNALDPPPHTHTHTHTQDQQLSVPQKPFLPTRAGEWGRERTRSFETGSCDSIASGPTLPPGLHPSSRGRSNLNVSRIWSSDDEPPIQVVDRSPPLSAHARGPLDYDRLAGYFPYPLEGPSQGTRANYDANVGEGAHGDLMDV